MKTLHIFSASPFRDTSLKERMALLAEQDSLLLTGDAVYALQAGTQPYILLKDLSTSISCYVLTEDVAARGLRPCERFTEVDYADFVRLCTEHDKVLSWT
ncbi:tRNA 2-thiouridine synthesizing protein B [Pseudomonas duriflava]|uniref:tRNA 2-thiouridine synthesizing protein B n=1 Tax=Pseudomonas duriflava TaxID=459528 RepID=A0A562Q1A1_9PSED|nr:sulfurtransferase complex subunit TusB [Pseudomonas duriflava]TWI50459.1 tRNA 2-thiouridine synthesizing protein B [Pseudomonas duriflava]